MVVGPLLEQAVEQLAVEQVEAALVQPEPLEQVVQVQAVGGTSV